MTSRLLLGFLLIFAGVTKLFPLQPAVITSWLFLPTTIVLCWSLFEVGIGVICLSLKPSGWFHGLIITLLSTFLLVLGAKWLAGEERCDCLGSYSLTLVPMAVLDSLMLVSVLSFSRFWRTWRWEGANPGFLEKQVRNLPIAVPVVCLLFAMSFGSIEAAFSFLSGDAVLVDASTKFLGSIPEGESVDGFFRLRNPTGSEIKVLGAASTCSCFALQDLPTTLDAYSSKNIRLRVYGRKAGSMQRESAKLFFDDSSLRVDLGVTVVVRPHL